MKEFLSITKKINKMKTAHLMEEIYRCQADIITFYTRKRRKSPKELDALYNRMSNEKFVKALKKIVKSDELELNPWFVVVITGFTTYAMHLPEDEKVSDEIMEDYSKIITKLLKKDVSKIIKKYNVSEEEVYNILIEAPTTEFIDEPKYIIPYAQRMFRKLYMRAKDEDVVFTAKTLRKVVKDVYGKEYVEYFALAALLERKDNIKQFNERQLAVWNMITDFALSYVEKQNKDDIKDFIITYAKRRESDAKREKSVAVRRLEFSSINTEDYPKLRSVTDKLKNSKKNNIAEFI